MKKRTRYIAFSAIISALTVAVLLLALLFPSFDITVALLASFLIVVAVSEFGQTYALMIYASSSILSFIIAPNNSGALFYIAFMGYYPILKSLIEIKIRNRISAIILKTLCFNVFLAIGLYVLVKFLAFEKFVGIYAIALIVLAEIAFVLYDILLTKFIVGYFKTIRSRLKIDKFLRK